MSISVPFLLLYLDLPIGHPKKFQCDPSVFVFTLILWLLSLWDDTPLKQNAVIECTLFVLYMCSSIKNSIGDLDYNHLKCSHRNHYFHTPDLTLIGVQEGLEKNVIGQFALLNTPQR